MKNKRILSFLLALAMAVISLISTDSFTLAANSSKKLKVNDTTLSYQEVIYVDTTKGNDTTGDGSKSKPFATVVKGFDYMNTNCRQNGAIVIGKGSYDISKLFDIGGTKDLLTKYNEMKISLLAEEMGSVQFNSPAIQWSSIQLDANSKFMLKAYGIIMNNTLNYAFLNCDEWQNEYYNCAFVGIFGGKNEINPANVSVYIENSVFNGTNNPYYTEKPLKGSSVNCASINNYIEPYNGTITTSLKNVKFDSKYNITTTGWKNQGTGSNPDGSKAHIGVYGGQFAWGSKVQEVEDLQIRTLKVVLEQNEKLQLSIDEDLTENTKLEWSSSDNTVAAVDKNGMVTAIQNGNTVITVKSNDGTYTEEIRVLVIEDAKEYRLVIDLKVGEKCRLTIDDAEDLVGGWSSMDPTIATVTNKGRVTAIKKGLTIVMAVDENGNEVGQVYIRVKEY